ncbi:PREDICTED: uncharacterized protein LOC107881011 [Prunus mume]|uniref:Uncharacterized protein LOC107881011 n=1 Tax=Prunus mume TaxID=102107 RepID=A0ABM1LPL7_PRUMU|nr:PREDICTED: uncharacterized protein LOC107881011 [Prunus mume]
MSRALNIKKQKETKDTSSSSSGRSFGGLMSVATPVGVWGNAVLCLGCLVWLAMAAWITRSVTGTLASNQRHPNCRIRNCLEEPYAEFRVQHELQVKVQLRVCNSAGRVGEAVAPGGGVATGDDAGVNVDANAMACGEQDHGHHHHHQLHCSS